MQEYTLEQTKEKTRKRFFQHNISPITTILSGSIFCISFLLPFFNVEMRAIGLFALSGALTNWLAIYMLFEKIPGLYGSGIIPLKFKEFKQAIYILFMTEFFTEDNIGRFFSKDSHQKLLANGIQKFTTQIDHEAIYQKLVQSIVESPLGTMLSMFGGAKALEPVKPYLLDSIKKNLTNLVSQAEESQAFKSVMDESFSLNEIKPKIEGIIKNRLDELTPKMVKEVVQNIIKEHLGWLVLWGGVFGGIFGYLSTLL